MLGKEKGPGSHATQQDVRTEAIPGNPGPDPERGTNTVGVG